MIAGDDEHTRSAMKAFIEALGLKVDVVESGLEALKRVFAMRGEVPRVVLVDLNRPGSAEALVASLRREPVPPRIVLLSDAHDLARSAGELGVEWLAKPVLLPRLYRFVAPLLPGRPSAGG